MQLTNSVRRECRTEDLQQISDYLDDYCKENQISFAHGPGKRKVSIKNTSNYSGDFWTGSFCTLCITAEAGYESEEAYTFLENEGQDPYIKPQTYEKWKKRLYVSKKFVEQREKSLKNITSEKGNRFRTNRSIQVEGAFGVLKKDYEFELKTA